MTKQRLLFFIGIWVAVLPYLGFPASIRKVFFLMTGLGIILLSYFMYIQLKAINEMDKKGGGIFAKDDLEEKESAPVVEDTPLDESLEGSEVSTEPQPEFISDEEESLDEEPI